MAGTPCVPCILCLLSRCILDPEAGRITDLHIEEFGLALRIPSPQFINSLERCRPAGLSVVVEMSSVAVLSSVAATSHEWLLNT